MLEYHISRWKRKKKTSLLHWQSQTLTKKSSGPHLIKSSIQLPNCLHPNRNSTNTRTTQRSHVFPDCCAVLNINASVDHPHLSAMNDHLEGVPQPDPVSGDEEGLIMVINHLQVMGWSSKFKISSQKLPSHGGNLSNFEMKCTELSVDTWWIYLWPFFRKGERWCDIPVAQTMMFLLMVRFRTLR